MQFVNLYSIQEAKLKCTVAYNVKIKKQEVLLKELNFEIQIYISGALLLLYLYLYRQGLSTRAGF